MANHKSAKKRARQTVGKTLRNKSRRTEVRSVIKKLRSSIESKEKEAASTLLTKAQSLLGKLKSAGILKAKTASRITSRLTSQVNKI